jgi:hypothetical protein
MVGQILGRDIDAIPGGMIGKIENINPTLVTHLISGTLSEGRRPDESRRRAERVFERAGGLQLRLSDKVVEHENCFLPVISIALSDRSVAADAPSQRT